jgi:preprotein translocase subunit SecG
MHVLIVLLRVFEVLVCLLLIGVILLQRSKGSGAGVSFGGGMGEAIFGAQMGNVLTKTTVILGIVFLVNTLILSLLAAQRRGGGGGDSLMGNEVPPPAATAPAQTPPAFPLTDGGADTAMPMTETPAASAPAGAAPVAAEEVAPSVPVPAAPAVPVAPAEGAVTP